MAELTPIERAMRVFDREPVDVMPFYTGMGMVLAPPIKERGWPFPKVHLEADKLAWSGIDSARYAKLDSVVIPYDMCWESEALGNKISLYEDSEDILYPTIPHKNWEEVEQVEITDDDINNIMQQGRMPLVPEAIKIIKANAPEIALGTWELGPFTQCGQTIELDRVLKAVFKKKELVTHILDRFTDMICTIVQALQAAGGDFFTLREPGVAADLLSPKTFKELIAPTMTKILSAWKGNKKCFHICGSTDPICEMMWECCVQSGTPMISFDIKNDLVASRKKLGDEAVIVGNYDVFNLPCREETTPEEAREGIRANIDGLVDAVWPGCDLWPDIKPENWFAMEEEARTYKVGPTPAIGRL